ncbi:COG3650 family protein [Marinovum sp.]|uniref:COG3650 family protein n=1 Tax=Marinovum sp. TaxID=2024839 RepID=UPI002B265F2D|nr:SH3 domain-containing protein [Marinovum sp.]
MLRPALSSSALLRPALLASLLACAAGTALAEPGYFRVTGVASDDTLNVRAEPDAGSADIGDLAHDQSAVEVLDTDASGDWGRITWEESHGWVAMRFLTPEELPMIGDSRLPAGLLCTGTEPFWSIRYTADTALYSDFNNNTANLPMTDQLTAAGRAGFPVLLRHGASNVTATAVIRAQLCSDGMSDRDYPYAAGLMIEAGKERILFDGCCRLPLEAGSN